MPDAFDWKAPNYDAIYERRMNMMETMRKPGFEMAALKLFFKDHPVEFIEAFGMTFDPRLPEIGLPATMPFLMFPKQAEFIAWVYNLWRTREDGLMEKSRDIGASWCCVWFSVWMWLFHPGAVIGFGSRKEEYVDDSGDPKALLWKARYAIQYLPHEFLPRGWNEKLHAPFMRVSNPENGAVIVGEAGDNIGRGARASIYFKDESAFYQHPQLIDAALSQTSNCKIDLSSVNGNANEFARRRHGGQVPVFTFHWTDDPRKDKAWYENEKRKLTPRIVASELDLDYNASSTDTHYLGESVEAAMLNGPADVSVNGGWIIGVDAAHMGDDKSIIHKRRGRLNLKQVKRTKLDGHALAAVVIEECRFLQPFVLAIIIELDGPGVSCYDTLKANPKWADKVVGVHTGTKLEDDRHFNVKAKLCNAMKEYLEQPPVSLARDPDLKSQLGSIAAKYTNGLLQMEAKKDYKKRVGRSPDEHDAFMLTFHDELPKPPPSTVPMQQALPPADDTAGY